MEKTESIQSIELKKRARRRLTGATALVMVATVVLPMILDKQPKPLEPDVVVKIPPLNTTTTLNANLDLPVKTTPLPSEANTNTASVNTPTQIATNTANEIKIPDVVNGMPTIQTNPEVNPENPKEKSKSKESKDKEHKKSVLDHEDKNSLLKEKETNKSKEIKESKEKSLENSGDKKFTIKLGTFTNDANAQKLKDKVGQSGVSVYSESVKNNEGHSATRVRAGPFNSKEEAQKALSKLESVGVSGGMVTSK